MVKDTELNQVDLPMCEFGCGNVATVKREVFLLNDLDNETYTCDNEAFAESFICKACIARIDDPACIDLHPFG